MAPVVPIPSSCWLAMPTTTAPASRRRRKGPDAVAEIKSRSLPLRAARHGSANMSFTVMGTPYKAPRGASWSIAMLSFSKTTGVELIGPSRSTMRNNVVEINSVGSRSPRAMAAACS